MASNRKSRKTAITGPSADTAPVSRTPSAPAPPSASPAEAQDGAPAASLPRAPAEPTYLAELNPAQRAAVEALEGPVLVLAGAGTGKTRVLTTRIAHILATGRARPWEILAVTFTNKAAREMKERVAALIGPALAEGMTWLGTFHAIGVKLLRRHGELVGLKPGFTILDTDDQIRLLKQLIEAERLDAKRWPARQLAALIDGWKNRGLVPAKVPEIEAAQFADGRGAELYAAYQARLKELNAADFGDLLLEVLRLFQENPDLLARYQARYRYLLVDEYQDTNVAQYLLLRLLAQGGGNIACVGDDDQSIYGWRGAEVDNILRFEKDFPGARVFRVEQNYRSTGHILGAASGLIAHNRARHGKTLFTDIGDGERVRVESFWDDEAEARGVADAIEALARAGHAYNDMAILVRASFQMRAFEDRFVTLGLPYRVIGGPRFYERAEIRDAIAYLDVTVNPANDLKFERIVNTPKRGLGQASVQKISAHARARGLSLFMAARELIETDELGPKQRASLRGLIESFDRWRGQIETMAPSELAEVVLDESGLTAMWQKDKSPQAHARLENLKELVRFVAAFDSLADFLEHVALVMDAEADGDGDRVSLMTLHAAKGLEFETVFLPGWEEGLFPHQKALDESGFAGLEEERRLAYVGLTRAKRRAHVSHVQNRRIHGLWQTAIASRFLDELPEAHVERIATTATPSGLGDFAFEWVAGAGEGAARRGGHARQGGDGRQGGNAGPNGAGQRHGDMDGALRRSRARTSSGAHSRRHRGGLSIEGGRTIEGEVVARQDARGTRYGAGERVVHQKFGEGTILEVDGDKLLIAFDMGSRKRVVDSFVQPAPV